MKTVRDGFWPISVAAGLARPTTAKASAARGICAADIADVDPKIAGAAAHEDATFICAMAARTKHAAPAVITVQAANGLALQMLKR